MPKSNQTNKIELKRRKVLAGTGAIGAAGLGTGLGTNALFSDEEQFGNNQLTAGTLDMKVSWAEHYFRDQDAALQYAHRENGELVIDDRQGFMDATLQEQFPDKIARRELDQGDADPCEVLADVPEDLQKPVIKLGDVKPGDFGEVTFDFSLCDNPGYVWLTGRLLENAENEITEPESTAPNENDQPGDTNTFGELADQIQTTIWYDDDCDNILDENSEKVIFQGTLRNALNILEFGFGLPLDGDRSTDVDEFRDPPDDTDRDCYADAPDHHCLGFRWELPVDRGHATQADSVTFDLGFYTEQCRNNLGWGVNLYHHCQIVANNTGQKAHDLHVNLSNAATTGPNGEQPWAGRLGEGTIGGGGTEIDFDGEPGVPDGDVTAVCWWSAIRENRLNRANPGYWTDDNGNNIGQVQVVR